MQYSIKIDPALEDYIAEHTEPEDELLLDLVRNTHLKVLRPRMLSGHIQGKLLKMLSHMVRPKLILELGTFTGYSAICLAAGLQAGGLLHTIEIDDEIVDFSQEYFARAGLAHCIVQHIGDATEIIPKLSKEFDLVFVDADKRQYPVYYHLAMQHLRPGGFMIADNVLWDGKVVDPTAKHDDYSGGIMEFNRLVQADPRAENMLLPLRDGLMMVRKVAQ